MINDMLLIVSLLAMLAHLIIKFSALRLNYGSTQNVAIYTSEEGIFSLYLLYLLGQSEHCKYPPYTE